MIDSELTILMLEAVTVYLIVLCVHSLRSRLGLSPFYLLLGVISAVNSWITNIDVYVETTGTTFMVGSIVFYSGLLLGVFVVYVLDGPQQARRSIFTIARVSILMPIVVGIVHTQLVISGIPPTGLIPSPDIRSNIASVVTIIADLVFLAIAWELSGKPDLRLKMWLRVFLTLLGVLWLDVLLFSTGAFAGTPDHLSIMKGSLLVRFVIALFASPILYMYLKWQISRMGLVPTNRPVLAILRDVAKIKSRRGPDHQDDESGKRTDIQQMGNDQGAKPFINSSNER